MTHINKTDRAILKVIEQYHKAHGYMPSYREICELSGISSSSSVQGHMTKLFAFGYLETDLEEDKRSSSRAFRLGKRL